MSTSTEALDRIARSGEAVFAIDSSDRIILWNKKCEEMLGRPARAVLGKRCYDVIGGRDENGNVYCYRNCPVAYQAREMPKEPVHRFQLSMETASGARKTVEVSLFAIPAYHPALSTVVHVLRDGKRKASALERSLAKEAQRTGTALADGDEGRSADRSDGAREGDPALSRGGAADGGDRQRSSSSLR